MRCEKTQKLIVTKSNALIEAQYRQKFTLEEQRFILYLIAHIQPFDEDFKNYEINARDFCDFTGADRKSIYKCFMDMSKSLISKIIEIRQDNKSIVMAWLSHAVYHHNEGRMTVAFDPLLRPYLLCLKNRFTSYDLANVITLKSVYSIRIYELLKQCEVIKTRKFELNELKKILSVDKDKGYDMYINFKKRVILPAQKELAAKCDIQFEFKEIKTGRKITHIEFKLIEKSTAQKFAKALRSQQAITTSSADSWQVD